MEPVKFAVSAIAIVSLVAVAATLVRNYRPAMRWRSAAATALLPAVLLAALASASRLDGGAVSVAASPRPSALRLDDSREIAPAIPGSNGAPPSGVSSEPNENPGREPEAAPPLPKAGGSGPRRTDPEAHTTTSPPEGEAPTSQPPSSTAQEPASQIHPGVRDEGLWIMASDGSRAHLLERGRVYSPEWSHDGSHFAYIWWDVTSASRGQNNRVHIVEDASGRSRSFPVDYVQDLSWSPRGDALLVDCAVMNLAGERLVQLQCNRRPAWSPDGSRLLFMSDSGYLTVHSLDTGESRAVYERVGVGNALAWTRDGSELIFVDENSNLVTLPSAGGSTRLVARGVDPNSEFVVDPHRDAVLRLEDNDPSDNYGTADIVRYDLTSGLREVLVRGTREHPIFTFAQDRTTGRLAWTQFFSQTGRSWGQGWSQREIVVETATGRTSFGRGAFEDDQQWDPTEVSWRPGGESLLVTYDRWKA